MMLHSIHENDDLFRKWNPSIKEKDGILKCF